jgi:rhodanese-related sulfurtransferase
VSGPSLPGLDAQGLPRGYPFRPDLELTPRQVKAAMASGEAVLIDCRTEAEWRTARIAGATLIPLDQLASRVQEIEALAEQGATIAVHCHHGSRSLKAAMFLRTRQIEAFSVAGGIDLWSIDIDPTVPRY